MYLMTFQGTAQTTHLTRAAAFLAARNAVDSLRANLGIQWVCQDASDDATIVRKWNVLHGTESGLFEVRKVSEGDVC